MALLILVRHGQSIWNAANLFTGWENIELSEKGILEAEKAAEERHDLTIHGLITRPSQRAGMTTIALRKEPG